jgi:hypothetical protein
MAVVAMNALKELDALKGFPGLRGRTSKEGEYS